MSTSIKKKIFLIAGEASGDVLGASLMRSLDPEQTECVGVGGVLMNAQGLRSLIPMSELNIMGIWEVIMQLPRLIKLINGVVEDVERENPEILVTIDFPDFNFEVAKRLKKRGIYKGRIIHYVAPTVWAWRPGRAKRIAQFLDGMMCLFPFEPKYFKEHDLDAIYVGHPLIYQDHKKGEGDFRKNYDIGKDDFIFGAYLGSRQSEIQRHKQIFEDTINFMLEQYPNLQVVLPTLPEVEFDAIDALKGINVEVTVVSDPKDKWNAMRSCDLALAVSGTVGLELAYMNIPHVVTYRTDSFTAFIVKVFAKVKYVHLVNIFLDMPAIPEFLQRRSKPILIAEELLRIKTKEELVIKQKAAFEKTRNALKKDVDDSPSDTAARYILKNIDP